MKWNNKLPINVWPKSINIFYRWEADGLYNHLRANKLTVILIPAPRPQFAGHMIRCATNHSPKWYKDLAYDYPNIRRDRSLRALNNIRNLQDPSFKGFRYKYECFYREYIHNMLIGNVKDETGLNFSSKKEIYNFFETCPKTDQLDLDLFLFR